MRGTTVILLTFLLAVMAAGFGVTALRVDGMANSIGNLASKLVPQEVTLSTDGKNPIEVNMQTQPCVDLTKTVNEIEVKYECCKKPGETNQEWGARCAMEFEEFCEGFGG